ncbi:MAG: hypothetical protein M1830_000295 [Pleopsidium flavum]|nr:MAG: hypothetical protein M1830_000295 [Pleopsidium flavum]
MSDEAPPSSASQSSATQTSETSTGSFAFFIHSQDSLNQTLPPDVDNKSLARQKRRRTSPEDHAILEAEYQRNSKPDKAARMDIVNRVALGEKEVQVSVFGERLHRSWDGKLRVSNLTSGNACSQRLTRGFLQIWFQNRRQNTRRKSRPLLPHEIPPVLRPGIADTEYVDCSSLVSDEISPTLPPRQDRQNSSINWNPHETLMVGTKDAGSGPVFGETTRPLDPSTPDVESKSSSQTTLASSDTHGDQNPSFDSSQRRETNHFAPSMITSFDRQPSSSAGARSSTIHPGYISNRRSAPTAFNPPTIQSLLQSSLNPVSQPSESRVQSREDTRAPLLLKRTSSLVRLSMSLGGKAKVTTNDENSPSPPRTQPLISSVEPARPGALQRSQSAIGCDDRSKESQNMPSLPWHRRAISGRSRDARTWEFYCDSDARNALTAHAEQEQSGSAVGAIVLLRSRSKKTLAPNANKRNLQASKAEAVKRVKASVNPEKPKLSRASSSMARLQTFHGNAQKQVSKTKLKGLSDGKQPANLRSPSGDSDKENWEPGTQAANVTRRRVPEAQHNRQRPILKENLQIPSQSSSLGAVLSRENMTPGRGHQKAVVSGEEGEEVAAFMGESSVPREEEDLDCVQNLLSLSQGAWR